LAHGLFEAQRRNLGYVKSVEYR